MDYISTIHTLEAYKKLTAKKSNHNELLKVTSIFTSTKLTIVNTNLLLLFEGEDYYFVCSSIIGQ